METPIDTSSSAGCGGGIVVDQSRLFEKAAIASELPSAGIVQSFEASGVTGFVDGGDSVWGWYRCLVVLPCATAIFKRSISSNV